MYQNIDNQWNENGQVTVPIFAEDLARTGARLEHLAALNGLKGILVLPPENEWRYSVFIPMNEPTPKDRLQLVRRLLAISTICHHFSHVQAIRQDKRVPKDVMPYRAYRQFLLDKGICMERNI